MAERRGNVRLVTRLEVQEKNSRHARVPLYVTGNISGGGMFLITQEPYPPGTVISLSFVLPADNKAVEAKGTVVWSRKEKENSQKQPGMGIQFLEIDEKDQQKIRKFVDSQQEDQ